MEKTSLKYAQDLSLILKADLFSTLLAKEHSFVVSRSGVFQLRRGAVLFFPGQRADRFYLLLEGAVRVYKNRSETEVARFASGDIIGDFDFARGADYDAYAEAAEDSTLIMFPGYGLDMDNLALESPLVVSKILLNSIVMTTNRIKTTRKIIIKNMSWIQDLQRKAYEDPGTGLWKQTFLNDEINRLLEDPTALIMLKPDRFKTLVDSRGHDAGDEAMVRIAMILRNITRRLGRGWPLRFKSNETGILVNKCDAALAESLAETLLESVAKLPPVPALEDVPAFSFTGTVVWGVWPQDALAWDSLYQGCYDLLLESWKQGGNRVIRFPGEENS
ncbi:MAG: diguanylate cyclase [Treponema sp.]|jgi:diguanylate cyclase (GGDEF)-like protein|nr:diguanylate cyclase [Treponema sp.]